MKKLFYLIIVIAAFGLIISGCLPMVPPTEQNEPGTLPNKAIIDVGPGDSIQTAIDDPATIPGDIIHVAAGTYAGFTDDKGLDIRGAQYNVDPAGALYRDAYDSSDETVITGPVKITADNASVNGFKMTSGSYIEISYASYSALNVNVSYNILENTNWADGAVDLNGNNRCAGGYIGYNTISGASGNGIQTIQNDNVTIEYNHILNSSGSAAINAGYHSGDGIVIHGNTITDSGGKGIRYWAGNDGVITDNVITNSTDVAIFTDAQTTISGNQISGGDSYGIQVYEGADRTTVTGNTISNPACEGIQSDVPVTITYNDISGGYNGIQLSNTASGSVIDNNTISNPSWIGIKSFVPVDITNNNINGGWSGLEIMSGAGGSTVNGNTVSGTTAEALRVFAQATITDNNFSGGYSGIQLSNDASGSVIDGNNIHDNQYYGLSIQSGVNDVTVQNNQFADNPYCGVIVWEDGEGSGIHINCNNITGNGFYGVESKRTTSNVDATCNWWGSHEGPSGEGSGTGDAVSTNVDFDPWISIADLSGPTYPVQIGAFVSVGYSYTCDMLPATISWGDGLSDSLVSNIGFATHAYSDAGVYTVTLTIVNSCDICSKEFQYVVVYDPTGGFVTGGGWIDSPAGAYTANPNLTGKATFGFVSKYKKGATVPTGNTEFQFKAGDLNFHSDSYEWLVIAGAKAMYKGTGTINGMGEYKFMLSAIDADINENDSFGVDRFRIKIWDKSTGTVIYDNQIGDVDDAEPATEIAGGQIVIHKGK